MNSRFILTFVCSLIFTSAAFGQNWLNLAGGSWGTFSNWSNDSTPFAPVFDLNSPAPGYTTSLPQIYDFSEAFAVQNDNVTVDLNGNGITTSALNVATTTGQTGSLVLVGPGNIDLSNGQTGQSANLDVSDQGGTGQLTVNDATITNDEDEAGHFDANGLLVENGGTINLLDPGNNSISNGTFNHSSLTATNELNANQISLSNGCLIRCGILTLGNATLDDSSIDDNLSATVDGVVNLSDQATLLLQDSTVSGTIYVLAGTRITSPALTMQGGTLSVELNSQVSGAIGRPSSSDNGTLDFTLQNGFEPTIGEQFTIFNKSYQVYSGTFAAINVPALPAGESWNISTLYSNGTISVVVPEPISTGMTLFGIAGLALRRRGKSTPASN